MTDNPYRLPRHALPRRYEVALAPDLAAASFTGTATITLDVVEATAELVCNAAELDILDAAVLDPDGTGRPVGFHLDAQTERLHLDLGQVVGPGPMTVRLDFAGTLNDKLRGFYRSTYTGADGAAHTIATTQMQATDCRRAFPCWDEPDFKAVFAISLVVDEGLTAISNGPEMARTPAGEGQVRVAFADTIAMSTYLVAFVVGELETTEPVDVGSVPLRIVHLPGKGHLTAFAQAAGAFALAWFQDYYGIAYPAEKVDLVAIPDFAMGAMENLGCITFREALLLVEPGAATMAEEQVVADVIAHELAHMWFGDLVTMRWWNGIWLNEAFATFMEVAACDAFRPDWKRWVSFGLERTAAFEVDALRSTRPVEFEVRSPADAEGMFDVLTYEKGGALLRMLQQYLGEEAFRAGIGLYLRTHRYGNTETSDLWDALEKATGEPVRRIMDTWIWQGGFPVIDVSLDGDSLVLSQRRFLFAGAGGEGSDDGHADDDSTRWAIPIQLRQPGVAGSEFRVLLDGDEARVELADASAAVVVNSGGNGFYRVHYTAELVGRLDGHALADMDVVERYGLVDDAWAAVVAGVGDAADFCALARSFADERELAVWQVVLAGLRWCGRFVDGAAQASFQGFVRALVAPSLHRLGWERQPDDDDLTNALRALLVRTLGVLGADPDTQRRARATHDQAVVDPHSVDPSVAAAALGVVAAFGSDADYDACLAGFRTGATPQEQLRYLYALAEFPDASQVARTLDFALSAEVRVQNAPFLIQRCLTHRDHGGQAWRFVREHWSEANARFPDSSIVRMVDGVKWLTEPAQQADVSAFFAEHPIPQATKTLEQILERQRINTALRARATEPLAAAFD